MQAFTIAQVTAPVILRVGIEYLLVETWFIDTNAIMMARYRCEIHQDNQCFTTASTYITEHGLRRVVAVNPIEAIWRKQ